MAEFVGGGGAETFYLCEPGEESGLPAPMSDSLALFFQGGELRVQFPDGTIRTVQLVAEDTP